MVESSDVSIVVDAQDCPPLPGLYGIVKLLGMILGYLVNFRNAVPIYMHRGAPWGHDSSVANFAQGGMTG